MGASNKLQADAGTTAIARFWEAMRPVDVLAVARSVATMSGRDVTDNARLLAKAAMAWMMVLIACFDAKYTYNFWRPVTAIRNADGDARDPGWAPFIDTPMRPSLRARAAFSRHGSAPCCRPRSVTGPCQS